MSHQSRILKALVTGLAVAATLTPSAVADPPALRHVQESGPRRRSTGTSRTSGRPRPAGAPTVRTAESSPTPATRGSSSVPTRPTRSTGSWPATAHAGCSRSCGTTGPSGRVVPTAVAISSDASVGGKDFSWSALALGIGLGIALAALATAAAIGGRRRVAHA